VVDKGGFDQIVVKFGKSESMLAAKAMPDDM